MNTTVLEIDFDIVSRKQNSQENQQILEACKPRLNYQCRVLLDAFEKGYKLTVADGIKGVWDTETGKLVHIGDLRARVRDIRDFFRKERIPKTIEGEKTVGNYKVYFLKKHNNSHS